MGKRKRSRKDSDSDSSSSSDSSHRKYNRKLRRLEKSLEKLKRSRHVSSDRTLRGSADKRISESMARSPRGTANSSKHSERTHTRAALKTPPPYNKHFSISGRRSPTVSLYSSDSEIEAETPTQTQNLGSQEKLSPSDVLDINAPLDDNLLNLLGNDAPTVTAGDPLHMDLASRWARIATSGMSSKDSKEMRDKYPSPLNCALIGAPKLNPEIAACMSQTSLKKDEYKRELQQYLGSGITAVGQALTSMLNPSFKNDKDSYKKVVEKLADAGRILSETQNKISISRRSCITPLLSLSVKATADNSQIDTLLYGSDLAEAINASKVIQKAGKDIRAQRKPIQYDQESKRPLSSGSQSKGPARKEQSLNYQCPPRSTNRFRRSEGGHQRPYNSTRQRNPRRN